MAIKIFDKDRCTGCHSCANTCPKKCISMVADNEGFLYPKVDSDKCVECGLCEIACPITSESKANNVQPHAYAAINKNTSIRLASSSGGLFTVIAEDTIDKGGIVFGASYDNDFNVIHTYTESKKGLEAYRGSKYVQSVIGETYKKAKMFLDNGRLVLFTGTPCQIAGLYIYLQKDYDNLITQDMICHGVPSPLVWRKYIEYRSKVASSAIQRISYRDKQTGWKTFSICFIFANYEKYSKTVCCGESDDPFYKVFLGNYCLRPSCYSCSFKSFSRYADITLADFWGVQSILPDMDDDKGTSLVIINSNKGEALLKDVSDKILVNKVDLHHCINYNSSYLHSARMPKERGYFLKTISYNDFDISFKKLGKRIRLNKLKVKFSYRYLWCAFRKAVIKLIRKESKKHDT